MKLWFLKKKKKDSGHQTAVSADNGVSIGLAKAVPLKVNETNAPERKKRSRGGGTA